MTKRRPVTILEVIWSGIASMASGTLRLVNSRRSWLINPKFQFQIIAYGMAIAGFALTLNLIAVRFFFQRSRETLVQASLPASHPIFDFLAQQERLMSLEFLAIVCFTVVFSFVLGVFLSHRVAGPMYRLRKHFEGISHGKHVAKVKFRDNDFFKDVADAYNDSLGK